MTRITFLVLAMVALSLPAACTSPTETTKSANEETSGGEQSSGYRGLQGSSGQSAEEAGAQIAGE